MNCELCKKELTAFDIRVQDLLQGICLNCVQGWRLATHDWKSPAVAQNYTISKPNGQT
jgi:hypothetical protein